MTDPLHFDYADSRPLIKGMHVLHKAVNDSGLEQRLLELVRTRASQINGCAHCLDMHTADALAAGEDHRRLHVLTAWRETTMFDDRERAALALTEAVTRLPDGPPTAEVEACEEVFAPDELLALVYAIVEINSWNRLAVAAGRVVGDQPATPTA